MAQIIPRCCASEATLPTLHLLCGKIASGKSTLAAELALNPGSIVLSEDRWLSYLYKDVIRTIEDYVQCAAKLRNAIKPHVISLLNAGVTVILDFPANTLSNREWMMGIIKESGARHQLHYLCVDDDVCKSRLRSRNLAGSHDFAATDEQFDLITRHFVEPLEEEGFTIIKVERGGDATLPSDTLCKNDGESRSD